mgnify:FL=1
MAKRHRNKSGSKRTKTKAGYWVQSYSEAKIDNWLYAHRLNYVYEPVFWIEDKRIVPDWVILPTPELGIEKSIIIEYWGLDYGPNEMKEVSEWVRQAAPKYRKRKETKEKAYLEMDNYYYLAISPHECTNLDDWLPKALNQLLGIQAFQKEDESSHDSPESMNHNQPAETSLRESDLKWRRIPRHSRGHAS